MKLAIILAFVLMGQLALASGGEAGSAHGIPWDLIIKQLVNFFVVVGLLTYLLKGKISLFFKGRAESFEKLLVVARKAKEDAEKQKREISSRLDKLSATSQESVDRARIEADQMKEKIQEEARNLARQLKEDAEASVRQELEKAKQDLREDLLGRAVLVTRDLLKTSVKESDQTRLQNESVEKIQVVR